MSIKEVVGTVIVIVIGGTAYTVSQTDVINNFAEDTGLSQQQAEEYVENLDESELLTFEELGPYYINDGQEILKTANEIDCVNYYYEWESSTLSCQEAKTHLNRVAQTEISLGQAYNRMSSETGTEKDIRTAVGLLEDLNTYWGHQIVRQILDPTIIDEAKKATSYNKALLITILESE